MTSCQKCKRGTKSRGYEYMLHMIFFSWERSCHRLRHADSCLNAKEHSVLFPQYLFTDLQTHLRYRQGLQPLKSLALDFDRTFCILVYKKLLTSFLEPSKHFGVKECYCHLCREKNPHSFQCLLHLMIIDGLELQAAFGQILQC